MSRYAEAQYGEEPIAIGIFTPGDTVTIQVLDLATDTLLAITPPANDCIESTQIPGFFYWDGANLDTALTGFHQCLYVMTNAAGRTHAGKLVIGGYPSDSAIRRFQQKVWIDTVAGAAGTAFPLGTPENPVSNVIDARTIANREKLTAYNLRGAITLTAAHQNWTFYGTAPDDAIVTVQAGVSVAGAEFDRCGIRGDLTGAISCIECMIGTSGGFVTGLRGTFVTCGFDGTIRPASTPAQIQGLDLTAQNANILNPGTILDYNSQLCIVLGGFKGYWRLKNVVHPAAVLAMIGDGLHFTAESTVAGGVVTLLGNGEFVNQATSMTELRDYLIRGSRIDVATGTRTTQAQILSDATPFPGGYIDAAISSVAVAGDQMNLTPTAITAIADAVLAESVGDHDAVVDSLAAVLRRVSHHSVGRAKFNTSNPLQWTLDVYEDDDRTIVVEQFNLKRLDGTAINTANPDPIADDLIADVDPV